MPSTGYPFTQIRSLVFYSTSPPYSPSPSKERGKKKKEGK
jgi:hypothetical protein